MSSRYQAYMNGCAHTPAIQEAPHGAAPSTDGATSSTGADMFSIDPSIIDASLATLPLWSPAVYKVLPSWSPALYEVVKLFRAIQYPNGISHSIHSPPWMPPHPHPTDIQCCAQPKFRHPFPMSVCLSVCLSVRVKC